MEQVIGVYINPEKKQDCATNAEELVDFLKENGYSATIVEACNDQSLAAISLLFVLGGDGSILRCAETCAWNHVAIVGINYGTVGFLAEFEKDEIDQILPFLQGLAQGETPKIRKSFLRVTCSAGTFFALNEIALRRDYNVQDSRMLMVETRVNGDEFDSFAGDGVLVSTPMGSTAYSLSAGGPILTPRTQAILLTPLCAFSLASRPIVFSDEDKIDVSIRRGDAFLLVDGRICAHIKEGDCVTTEKADLEVLFPTRSMSLSSFYKKVRKKLS